MMADGLPYTLYSRSEYKGYLYMGGDVVSHIGKYKLAEENYTVKK